MEKKKKILILDNFLNQKYSNLQRILEKFLKHYREDKLNNLIKKIKKNNGDTEIRIITNRSKTIKINYVCKIDLLSDIRLNLERTQFLEIRNDVIKCTKNIISQLSKNLYKLKTFNINRIFIGKLIEYELMLFLNKIFGEFILVKKILIQEKYDKIILFNYNPFFMQFFKDLNKNFRNLQLYKDPILNRNFVLSRISIINYFFSICKRSLTNLFLKKNKKISLSVKEKKDNIIFIHHTKNEYNCAKPVYQSLKKEKIFNPIYYKGSRVIPFNKINNLTVFLYQINKILRQNNAKILKGIGFESLKLNFLLREFSINKLYYNLIDLYILLNHFIEFVKYNCPSLVIITEEVSTGRLFANFCKIHNIPTIYIPHSALPVQEELKFNVDFNYIAVPGDLDKDYLIRRGESNEKIKVTGRPVYERFYKQQIKKIFEVSDIFNKNKKYIFETGKFSILYTTNPRDDKSREKLFKAVINSVKELNLLDNLIIKLHPIEDPLFYKKILEELNVDTIIVKDYNVLELINSSNLLLARISTTLLEAMIIGVSVIVLNLTNLDFNATGTYLFLQENSLIKVENQEDLTKKMKELILDTNLNTKYSKTLKELSKKYSFYDENESPTQKIIKLINILIKRNKN